jgi:hypothetical protein
VQSSAAGTVQRIERDGLQGRYRVAWVIGSGNHALGFLVQVGDYLFQSPVSFYSERKIWDMAPGYERDPEPDFTRPVTAECVWCHAGRPRPVAGTLNRYEDPPFEREGIFCDRCHGPVESHLREPSSRTIVNPAKLPPRPRDSICEQCHLAGEARVPNSGREIGDFRPGQELEEVFTVYVRESTDGAGLKVVSHVEQLARSACARNSAGRMWCGTCHNPHEKPATPESYYRERCLNCHGSGLAATHPKPSGNCTGCHMPRRPVWDGGHTVFTDHRISRRPEADRDAPAAPVKLAAWHEPKAALAARNLALANVIVGERDHSATHMDAAAAQLMGLLKTSSNDAPVLARLGMVAYRKGMHEEAAELFEYAIRLEPGNAGYYVNAAAARRDAGEPDKSIQYLERAISLDSSLEQAYQRLGEIYLETHQAAKMRQTL